MADNITAQDIRKAMYKNIEMDFNITRDTVDLFAVDIPGYYKVTLFLELYSDVATQNYFPGVISFSVNLSNINYPYVEAKSAYEWAENISLALVNDSGPNKEYIRLVISQSNTKLDFTKCKCKMYTEVVTGYISEFFPIASSTASEAYVFSSNTSGLSVDELSINNNLKIIKNNVSGQLKGALSGSNSLNINFGTRCYSC